MNTYLRGIILASSDSRTREKCERILLRIQSSNSARRVGFMVAWERKTLTACVHFRETVLGAYRCTRSSARLLESLM